MNIQSTFQAPTVVSTKDIVWDSGRLLVEATDGSVWDFTCDIHPNRTIFHKDAVHSDGWTWEFRFQTKERIAKLCQEINRDSMYRANQNLHLDKVRRLGWDYAKRGY